MIATVSYGVENDLKLEVPSNVEFEVSKTAALEKLKSAQQLYLEEDRVKVTKSNGEEEYDTLLINDKIYQEYGEFKGWLTIEQGRMAMYQIFKEDGQSDFEYSKTFTTLDLFYQPKRAVLEIGDFMDQTLAKENILAVGGNSVNTHIIYKVNYGSDGEGKMNIWLENGKIVKIQIGEITTSLTYDFTETIPEIPNAEWVVELSEEEAKEIYSNARDYSKMQNKIKGTSPNAGNEEQTYSNGIIYVKNDEPFLYKQDEQSGIWYRYSEGADGKYYKTESSTSFDDIMQGLFAFYDVNSEELNFECEGKIVNGEFVISLASGDTVYEYTIKDDLIQSVKATFTEDRETEVITMTYTYGDTVEDVELPDVEWILETE